MSFGLLNPAMLLGLIGVAVPVIVHLLSRRNVDTIPWGAMQFLELAPNTRRRVQLDELLLMLLRMLLIALLVVALARPWVSGRWVGRLIGAPRERRDVVLILDGSSSMDWQGGNSTPRAASLDWIERFLAEVSPGDTLALFEARDLVRPLVAPATTDIDSIRRALDELPPVGGSADLAAAVSAAARLLAHTENPTREIIVLTDGQAHGWSADDAARWEAVQDLRDQVPVPPLLRMIDCTQASPIDPTNFSVETLELSRQWTAANLPVRIRTRVRYTGGALPLQRRVTLEVDGRPIAAAAQQTSLLAPGGEFEVEFEHRFTIVGAHVVSVALEGDNVPGDDRAEAVITVAEPLPVLLIDGDPHLNPLRSELFFVRAALTIGEAASPLVTAQSVTAGELQPAAIATAARGCIVLANVALEDLPMNCIAELEQHVSRGGGLLISLGNRARAEPYNAQLFRDGQGLLPARLLAAVASGADDARLGVSISDRSLALPFLAPFGQETGGNLTAARFTGWWRVAPRAKAEEHAPLANSTADSQTSLAGPAVVAASFENGDACLVVMPYGRGRVALLTVPLDADGSTLPAQPDFVPLLHECLFHLAQGSVPRRNMASGEPLVWPLPAGINPNAVVLQGPDGREQKPDVIKAPRAGGVAESAANSENVDTLLRLNDTTLPGRYEISVPDAKARTTAGVVREPFVVNFDRREGDLARLDDDAKSRLTDWIGIRFSHPTDTVNLESMQPEQRAETWRWLMIALLILLVGEVCLTRRMVRGALPGEL